MNDNKFQKLLDDLAVANNRYKSLLKAAEDEIVKRYGQHPSDIDNDDWIDSYHVGCGSMTVKQVDDSMWLHLKK